MSILSWFSFDGIELLRNRADYYSLTFLFYVWIPGPSWIFLLYLWDVEVLKRKTCHFLDFLRQILSRVLSFFPQECGLPTFCMPDYSLCSLALEIFCILSISLDCLLVKPECQTGTASSNIDRTSLVYTSNIVSIFMLYCNILLSIHSFCLALSQMYWVFLNQLRFSDRMTPTISCQV